jgi:glycerol-3-phosphate O-acyltransferase 3/4
MLIESIIFILVQVLVTPVLFLIILTFVLAAFGKSLGIRRLYVRVLISIFEYARQASQIAVAQKRRISGFYLGDGGEEDPNSSGVTANGRATNKSQLHGGGGDNGGLGEDQNERVPHVGLLDRMKSRHNVISRKDNLILTPASKPAISKQNSVIQEAEPEEEAKTSVSTRLLLGESVSANTLQREFELDDVLDYVKTGVAAIIEDEVTQRFVAEELKNWNLLTRTNQKFEFINWKLTFFWFFGFFFRYCVLFPGRLAILAVGLFYLAIGTATVGQLKSSEFKRWLNFHVFTSCFQVLSGALSAVIKYHNTENRPKTGICVANHTSVIDVLILACDNAYALIGQQHGGLIGFFERQLSKASPQIWFERSEAKDRLLVTQRLKAHVEDPKTLPILIFPEGTCINNTSVMQFKKGSFEVGGVVYPVAIKYDPKFGDAFWNSSKDSMMIYLFKMMTSWAIVVDVWYLPPMIRQADEDAIDFANRVKKELATCGGLVDLVWDGNLKRQAVKTEWKEAQQEEFSRRIKVD